MSGRGPLVEPGHQPPREEVVPRHTREQFGAAGRDRPAPVSRVRAARLRAVGWKPPSRVAERSGLEDRFPLTNHSREAAGQLGLAPNSPANSTLRPQAMAAGVTDYIWDVEGDRVDASWVTLAFLRVRRPLAVALLVFAMAAGVGLGLW